MLKPRNAQLGGTLTWFTATIIVFLMILIYLGFAGTAAASKSISSVKIISKSVDLDVQRKFVGFLEKQVEVDGEFMTIAELAINAQDGYDDYCEEFKKQGNIFLSNFSTWGWFSEGGFDSYGGIYGSSFIRIYAANEVPNKYPNPLYKFNTYECMPQVASKNIDADKCDFDNANYFEIILSKDKKLVACMEYKNE